MPVQENDAQSGPDPAFKVRSARPYPSMSVTWCEAEPPSEALPDDEGTKRTEEAPPEMLRFNSGKFRLTLIPPSFNYYTAAVLEYGAIKYSANNWRKGCKWTAMLDSLQRHIDAFRAGEDFDPESGLPHVAHMSFNVMGLIEFFDKGLGTDDRFRYAGQPVDAQHPGRVLEFRRPPVQPSAA